MPRDMNPRVVPGPPPTLPGAFGQPIPLPRIGLPPLPAASTEKQVPAKKPVTKVPHPAKPAGMTHHKKRVAEGKAAVVIKPSAERKKGR